MPTHRKIIIIGKQRAQVDPARMVQVIIALGRQMWQERKAAEERQQLKSAARREPGREASA